MIKKEIIATITEFEIFEESFWYHSDILERIKPISFKLMILRGKDEAKNQYNYQIQLIKKNRDELNINKETAEQLRARIGKLYKLQTSIVFSMSLLQVSQLLHHSQAQWILDES